MHSRSREAGSWEGANGILLRRNTLAWELSAGAENTIQEALSLATSYQFATVHLSRRPDEQSGDESLCVPPAEVLERFLESSSNKPEHQPPFALLAK